MPGAVIGNPIPDWLKPENASVLDSPVTKAIRALAHLIGADDPQSQVLGLMTPLAPEGQAMASKPVQKALKTLADLGERVGIKAYHGSPHDFDQFSLSKIGTGEGAQAYGHGLYFAENEGVARSYRDALSAQQNLGVGRTRPIGSAMTLQEQRSVEAANRAMKAYAPAGEPPLVFRDYYDYYNKRNDITLLDKAYQSKYSDRLALQVAKLREIQQSNPRAYADIMGNETPESIVSPYRMAYEKAGEAFNRQAGGRMYEVQINADPDQLLDWDKPLSQQSGQVQSAAQQLIEQAKRDAQANNRYAAQALLESKDYVPADPTGADIHRILSRTMNDGAQFNQTTVSKALREQGIPGIKYLDGGSRAAGEGSRNFVIFDDSLIDILKKYGVALPVIEGLRRKANAQGGKLRAEDVQAVF